MFIPASKLHFLASFQCTVFPRLSCLLLYSFCASLLQPLTIWSILSPTFLHILHKESPWLLSIFYLTRFVLILWFWVATIRLSVSLFKSPFWSQAQHWSLLTSLVCLKYWPCRTFSSQSSNLFSFFDLFKTLAASKPLILSPLASCINLSSLSWRYTSKHLIANSIQSSMDIKPLPPSFVGICNTSTSDLGCNAPYMVNNVLVFLSKPAVHFSSN